MYHIAYYDCCKAFGLVFLWYSLGIVELELGLGSIVLCAVRSNAIHDVGIQCKIFV